MDTINTIRYKPKDFAILMGVSVKTLQRWDRDNVLKAKRTLTNRRYYTYDQYLRGKDLKEEAVKELSMRKVRIGTDDSRIIVTNAPEEVIWKWIKTDATLSPSFLEEGGWFVKVLYDYMVDTMLDPAVVGCDELYDMYGYRRDELLEWANTKVY